MCRPPVACRGGQTFNFMVIIGRRAPPVLPAGARGFMMMLLTTWQGSSNVQALLARARKQTFFTGFP